MINCENLTSKDNRKKIIEILIKEKIEHSTLRGNHYSLTEVLHRLDQEKIKPVTIQDINREVNDLRREVKNLKNEAIQFQHCINERIEKLKNHINISPIKPTSSNDKDFTKV